MMRRAPAMLAAIAAAVVLSACGGTQADPRSDAEEPPEPAATRDAASPAATEGPAAAPAPDGETDTAVPEALAWSAPALAGGTFDAATYAGRDVVLWMWAPW